MSSTKASRVALIIILHQIQLSSASHEEEWTWGAMAREQKASWCMLVLQEACFLASPVLR